MPCWGNKFRTDIQRCVFLSCEIVNVRDPQRLNGGLSDPSQDVSQEHVDPHGQVGLAFTPWRTRPVNKTLRIFTPGVVCFCAHMLTSVGHFRHLASPGRIRWRPRLTWRWVYRGVYHPPHGRLKLVAGGEHAQKHKAHFKTRHSGARDRIRAGCYDSPPDDEVRQSDDEGSDGHQHTADRDDLGPMELGAKVTDESDDQQVAWRDRGRLELLKKYRIHLH